VRRLVAGAIGVVLLAGPLSAQDVAEPEPTAREIALEILLLQQRRETLMARDASLVSQAAAVAAHRQLLQLDAAAYEADRALVAQRAADVYGCAAGYDIDAQACVPTPNGGDE
jgi:hypothetical protein